MITFLIFYLVFAVIDILAAKYYNNKDFLDKTNKTDVGAYTGLSLIPVVNIFVFLVLVFFMLRGFIMK